MEKLRGHGLRDDAIGVLQVGDTIIESLINGWWIVTIEECMTNDHGPGYYMELLVNSSKSDLVGTGFLTIDDRVDGMFVGSFRQVTMFLGWNMKYFRDKEPNTPEALVEEACGWCGETIYPHVCENSLTELTDMVSTANASAPKPAKVPQDFQDRIDLSQAAAHCDCGSPSPNWENHQHNCPLGATGIRISSRKRKVARLFRRKRS